MSTHSPLTLSTTDLYLEVVEAGYMALRAMEELDGSGCFDGFGRRDPEGTKDFYNRPEVKRLVQALEALEGKVI